jgi:hypothetical protein
MKKPFHLVVFALVAAAPVALHGQDTAPLGSGNVSVKFGYVVFAEGAEEDDGVYLGLEGYGRVAANLYLGGEIAAASSFTLFGDEMRLVPFEVNVKYARGVGSNFVVAGGAGLSYSAASFCEVGFFASCDLQDSEDAWLFGGQIFGDFVYRIKWLDFGISAKYQLLQDFEEVAADFSNLRLGLQLGFIF